MYPPGSIKLSTLRPLFNQPSRIILGCNKTHWASWTNRSLKVTQGQVKPGIYVNQFSSSIRTRLKDCVCENDHEYIRKTKAAWPHPQYSPEQLKSKISYAHRKPQDFSDRIALYLVRFLRFCTDFATGYKHDTKSPKLGDNNSIVESKPYRMSEKKWLIRFVFLESVAGVPGMVAGMLRHLHSLRRLKRDNGWIETLLEEAYNERMHLLTFLKMAKPGWFMKVMIIGAQGVFFNGMFLSYLISPKTCHRFVGYLEEEAVLTYSLAIQDIEDGKLPTWSNSAFRIPDIAINYWRIPENNRNMRDMLLYIRADEAKHREVNHTLGNLDQNKDANPFVNVYENQHKPHPGKSIDHIRSTGWERHEVI